MNREPRHGTVSEYNNHKCRCAPCREANREYRRKRRTLYIADKERTPDHGTRNEYSNYGCRCDKCREAYSIYQKNNKAARAARGLSAGNASKPRGVCKSTKCTEIVVSTRSDAMYCSRSCATSHSRAVRGMTWRSAGWDRKQLVVFSGDRTIPPVRESHYQ